MDEIVLEGEFRSRIDVIAGGVTDRTGFDLLDAEGLGPTTASVNYLEHAMVPGGEYQSHNTQSRNIVLRVGFTPDYNSGKTVQQLRRELYQIAMPGNEVRVRLYNDETHEMRIDGWVETHEPAIFSKDPEVQISIICPSPYYREPGGSSIDNIPQGGHGWHYHGEIVTGLILDIEMLKSVSWIRVEDIRLPLDDPRGRDRFVINHEFSVGDNLRIRTAPGSKEASHRDSNMVFQNRLLGRVTILNGGWPEMRPGYNRVRVTSSEENGIRWNISLIKLYGGF